MLPSGEGRRFGKALGSSLTSNLQSQPKTGYDCNQQDFRPKDHGPVAQF